jgi:hypothetical protein
VRTAPGGCFQVERNRKAETTAFVRKQPEPEMLVESLRRLILRIDKQGENSQFDTGDAQ